jgi:hypothetical protein
VQLRLQPPFRRLRKIPCISWTSHQGSVVLQAATDSVYFVKQTIPITDGTHQMYAVWLPLDLNQPAFASSTEKIVIKTMGEGENE